MSKPEFSKEFSIQDAKAGAPYCMRSGEAVEILKWNSANEQSLIGIIGPSDTIQRWFVSGQWGLARSSHNDLVMLPLGMIDGKPVFVGDEFEELQRGSKWAKGRATPDHAGVSFSNCRWPATARIYPVTTISPDYLRAEYNSEMGGLVDDALRRTANLAIKHAIDSKQVITADEHKAEIADLHSKWVAQITEMNGKRAARDMAVAKAVRLACLNCFHMAAAPAATHIKNIDLGVIIASVTP